MSTLRLMKAATGSTEGEIRCTEAVDIICFHLPTATTPEDEDAIAQALDAIWSEELERILASGMTCVVDASEVQHRSMPMLRIFARMARDLATIGRELRVESPQYASASSRVAAGVA